MPGLDRSGVLELVNNVLTRLLDAGFGHPRGLLGRLGGALMAWGNGEQERWAVEQARLRPGHRVLAVGSGPGVGLQLAAAKVSPEVSTEVRPGGQVIGVDPSAVMRDMARTRCASLVAEGVVVVADGTAERTGCESASVDAVISVNNIMLWDRPTGFVELARVLRPGGRLVITVHRHVLDAEPAVLGDEARRAGLVDVHVDIGRRQRTGPKVQLLAVRP